MEKRKSGGQSELAVVVGGTFRLFVLSASSDWLSLFHFLLFHQGMKRAHLSE